MALRLARLEAQIADLENWRDLVIPQGSGRQAAGGRMRLRQQLHAQMHVHLDINDLHNLCFDLGVDFDDLGGGGKDGRIRELILLAVQRGMMDELLGRLAEIRPKVIWPVEIE